MTCHIVNSCNFWLRDVFACDCKGCLRWQMSWDTNHTAIDQPFLSILCDVPETTEQIVDSTNISSTFTFSCNLCKRFDELNGCQKITRKVAIIMNLIMMNISSIIITIFFPAQRLQNQIRCLLSGSSSLVPTLAPASCSASIQTTHPARIVIIMVMMIFSTKT